MASPTVVVYGSLTGKPGDGKVAPMRVNSEGGISAGGYRSQVTITRPANTTAYTAADVVGGAFEIPLIGPSGSHLLLTTVDLRIDVSAVPSGMGPFRLELYSATPPSALPDNDPWDLPSGDRSVYIGSVSLPTPVDKGSTLFAEMDALLKHIKLATGVTSLFGYLVTTGAFTPAGNSEVYVVTVRAMGV